MSKKENVACFGGCLTEAGALMQANLIAGPTILMTIYEGPLQGWDEKTPARYLVVNRATLQILEEAMAAEELKK